MTKQYLCIAALVPMLAFLCHCDAEQLPGPQSNKLTEIAVSEGLRVQLPPSAEDRLNVLLTQQLSARGFIVAVADKGPYDIRVNITQTTSEKPGIFNVVVNGQRRVNYESTVSVTVQVGENPVGTATIQFDASDGPSSSEISQLAEAIGPRAVAAAAQIKKEARQAQTHCLEYVCEKPALSPPPAKGCKEPADKQACDTLAGYVKLYPNGTFVEEATRVIAAFNAGIEVQGDEAAWLASNSRTCEKAQTAKDCDGVREYQNKYPKGAYAVTSRAILQRGEQNIRRAKARQAWVDAKPEECEAARKEDSCDGVRKYLEANPDGANAEEARAILSKAEAAIAARGRTQSCAVACATTCADKAGTDRTQCIDFCKQARCK